MKPGAIQTEPAHAAGVVSPVRTYPAGTPDPSGIQAPPYWPRAGGFVIPFGQSVYIYDPAKSNGAIATHMCMMVQPQGTQYYPFALYSGADGPQDQACAGSGAYGKGAIWWITPTNTCPAHSAGDPLVSCTCKTSFIPNATATACVCPAGAQLDAAGTACVPQPEQYTLTLNAPAGDIEPVGAPAGSTSKAMSARVVNRQTGAPKAGAVVRILLDAVASTGGHAHHDDRRPKGSLSGCAAVSGLPGNYSCTTDPDGYANFTFNATPVSGTHTIAATCTSLTCINDTAPNPAAQDVKVPGLSPILASPFYAFVGATDSHPDNHYLTPQAEAVLKRIAVSYRFERRFGLGGIPLPLTLNDASLVWGGVFDYTGNWNQPHVEHRRGTAIDVRANNAAGAIPSGRPKREFIKLLRSFRVFRNNGVDFLHENIGTNNEHFHIRLLGVKG
ncbi:MAG: hypothetical protein ACOY3V_02205 [Pseudomonadota bacterium]